MMGGGGGTMATERVESHLDEEILSRMFDGEVSPDEFVGVLRHLSRCDRCRREALEFWDVVSVLSDLGPDLTRDAEELSGDLAPLEEMVLAKLSDLISIHWASCIPGVRRSRAKMLRLKSGIELDTKRAVAVRLGKLKSGILSRIMQGSRPDLKVRPQRRRPLLPLPLHGERFHRLFLAFRTPVQAIGPLGKVALAAWSGIRTLAGTFARFM